MKKYLFAMLMAVGVLTSCSNDDIEVNVVESNRTTFTYSVETQSVYDKFTATSLLKSRFLSGKDGNYYLGIYTYIYDKDGQLVDSKTAFNNTFGEESLEFTLNDGTYTAVTVEMVVDKDNKYESEVFEIVGTDLLSTIEIAYKTDSEGKDLTMAPWWQCIGAVATELRVNSLLQDIKITPKPIGFIVDYAMQGFENTGIKYAAVYTKDVPKGRYLDPSKIGTNRFHYQKYSQENEISIRMSSIINETTFFGAYMFEEGDVNLSLGVGRIVGNNSISWSYYPKKFRDGIEDGNNYWGGIAYLGVDNKEWDYAIFDTEKELYDWFSEMEKLRRDNEKESSSLFTPNTTWGAKVSTVHNSMSAYTQTVGTSTTGVYDSDFNQYYTEYQGMDNARAVQYYFTSSTTGLVESDVFYDASKYSVSDIKKELDNNYMFITETENGSFGYISSDQKTMVILMKGNNYHMVGYYDYSSLQGSKQVLFAKAAKAMRTAPANIISPMATFAQKCELSKPFMMDKNNMKSQMISVKR